MGFNQATRQAFAQMNRFAFVPNGVDSQQITQVGFLAKILIPITLTFTTIANFGGAVMANKVAPQLTPYQLVRRLAVRTNEGAEIYSTSGEGNYLLQRHMRTGFDPRNPQPSPASTIQAAQLFSLPDAYAPNTTYKINFTLVVPIAWGESLLSGLILLQNPTTRLTTELTWGTVADLFTVSGGGAGDSLITANSVQVTNKPMMEFFNLPASDADYPDMSMVHVILEDEQSIGSTGDFNYRPPLGNMMLRVIQEFTNGDTRMNATQFEKLALTYAQTQQAYVVTPEQQAYIQAYRLGGSHLPDGVFSWDFTFGVGMPEVPNTRDVIDTSRLTDLSIITTIAQGVNLQNAKVRTIREMLAPIAR